MTWSTTSEIAVALIACPYCNAQPGEPCVTRSVDTRSMADAERLAQPVTGRASWPHTLRTTPVYEAWREGYHDGMDQAVDTVRRETAAGRPLTEVIDLLTKWSKR